MAHYKRRRPRAAACGHYSRNGLARRLDAAGVKPRDRHHWTFRYPRWWDEIYHTRPTRTRTRKLEQSVLHGADPDNICWPDGRKPHIYYW